MKETASKAHSRARDACGRARRESPWCRAARGADSGGLRLPLGLADVTAAQPPWPAPLPGASNTRHTQHS